MSKKLMLLVLMLAVVAIAVPAAQALPLITEVAHRNTDADAPEDPQIAPNPLDEGALTFLDRTHVYADVPESLIGAEYVILANDNKNMSAYEVDITVSKNAIIYVFVDNRMGGAAGGKDVAPNIDGMPWLTEMGFVDTGIDIGIDESADGSINQYFSVFALEVKAGTVTIGGCTEGHGGNMLGVAAMPAPTSDTATNPVPEDTATDVVREVVLEWTAGETAVTHDVYLGTVFEDVNTASRANPLDVMVSQGQSEATYDAGVLDFGTTYYWRVDEVNGAPDNTIFKGDVWSFTTEPYAYPIEDVIATTNAAVADAASGIENIVNGSGLNADDEHSTAASDMWLGLGGDEPVYVQFEFDKVRKLHEMWVWNYNVEFELVLGFGLKDVTIEYSTDGADWTALKDAEFARASARAGYAHNTVVDMEGVAARYVRVTVNDNWGMLTQYGLSEVRFLYVPVQARQPQPADAATDVATETVLSWRAGREATSHEVYLGTDSQALPLIGTVEQTAFTPDALNLGTTYYWRIDEVGADIWTGDVWTFSTQEYALVDGFETYNDDIDAGTTIFDTWLDGWVNDTGSTVGYFDAPFAEQTIVRTGAQSMPIQYDNTNSPFYSEAERIFDDPQDWTANGIRSLSLFFRGDPDNTGQLYVKINNTKVPYDGDPADIAKTVWLPWNIDLSNVGGNLRNVNSLTIGIEGNGSTGILYVDDVRLYPKAPEFIVPTEPDAASLMGLWALDGNANDTSGNGLNGTVVDGQFVASGRPDGGMALQVNDAGHADLGNPAALDFATGDWTVTAWYKTGMTGTGDDNKGTIYGKGGDTGGGHRYCLIVSETTEGVVTLVCDDDVTKYVIDSTSVTNDDEWHAVAGQRQGAELRIFIDGQLEASTTATEEYSLAGTSQHNAYIGAITNHTAGTLYKTYIGLLDDVRVYDTALSEGEILWLAGGALPLAKPF